MLRRRAFTLIELLVVIALLAVLVGLLIPAIQKALESGNRAGCQNNLKQMGLAVSQYVADFGYVPSEGGAPSANGGPGNNASVFFNLLPYLEQAAIYDNVGQNQVVNLFICPSDPTNASGVKTSGGLALGSYCYSLYNASDPTSGVFPQATTPPTLLPVASAMSDGTSTTVIMGEHVQLCGGGSGTGGGPGGPNPWGTISNKRFPGASDLAPRAIVVGVTPSQCTVPPNPAPGVSVFSTGHSGSILFLMGDGSARACSGSVDVTRSLVPALTARAGDVSNDF